MNKIVIVINGKAEVGKDTLCDFVINHYFAEKISSITPILKIARDNGWNGTKNSKSRKFLSDLKRAFIDFNNLPNIYLVEECNRFLQSDNDILFVHIRESDQINEFLLNIKNTCVYCTLLINNMKKKKPVFWGNDSDDYVDNYRYSYTYYNIMTLEKAEKDFLVFFQKILEDLGINPRKREQIF
jgi:hypothetical protein